MKRWKHTAGLFCLGGFGYAAIELAWRSYTHWTMVLTGGMVFVGLAILETQCAAYHPLMRYMIGALWVTTAEFLVGLSINHGMGMDVWDYSAEWCDLYGQICPKYMVLWFFLCAVAMPLARESAKLLAKRAPAEYNAEGELSEKRVTAYAHRTRHWKQSYPLRWVRRGRDQVCRLDCNRPTDDSRTVCLSAARRI